MLEWETCADCALAARIALTRQEACRRSAEHLVRLLMAGMLHAVRVPGPEEEALEREIVAILPTSPWTVQVGRLLCLRGIDTLTAVGLCAEIGDFERFARAGRTAALTLDLVVEYVTER